MTRRLLLLVLTFACFAQERTRLADIRTIYVHPLGDTDGAALLRERLIAKFVNVERFQVVDAPGKADAEIVGKGEMTKGERAHVYGGIASARTVYDTILVVRLMDKQKNVLWAYDSSEDSKRLGPVGSLLKAIEKESKNRPKPK